ncbi:hypothetical protein BJ508DRAFT_326114 [Ascobolus immersus RN42]|uniref:Uncharacterized protein n=1 Tax=Ascobolus immersus RN42 TaxID=1160509 RepID=A0A3N4IAE1_ASCIM|nr:hypothetical protein BJ508DRAFT_326114 [Ascobolus immersus RN42]
MSAGQQQQEFVRIVTVGTTVTSVSPVTTVNPDTVVTVLPLVWIIQMADLLAHDLTEHEEDVTPPPMRLWVLKTSPEELMERMAADMDAAVMLVGNRSSLNNIRNTYIIFNNGTLPLGQHGGTKYYRLPCREMDGAIPHNNTHGLRIVPRSMHTFLEMKRHDFIVLFRFWGIGVVGMGNWNSRQCLEHFAEYVNIHIPLSIMGHQFVDWNS